MSTETMTALADPAVPIRAHSRVVEEAGALDGRQAI